MNHLLRKFRMPPRTFRLPQHRGAQSGVTLIEILITLLVLAVGLLGLAALQGLSLQAGQTSLARTQATNLAYEVIDHARANRSRVETTGNLPNETFFENRAAAQLPNGELDVVIANAGLPVTVTVTVTWLDDRTEEDADDQKAEFEFESRI